MFLNADCGGRFSVDYAIVGLEFIIYILIQLAGERHYSNITVLIEWC